MRELGGVGALVVCVYDDLVGIGLEDRAFVGVLEVEGLFHATAGLYELDEGVELGLLHGFEEEAEGTFVFVLDCPVYGAGGPAVAALLLAGIPFVDDGEELLAFGVDESWGQGKDFHRLFCVLIFKDIVEFIGQVGIIY